MVSFQLSGGLALNVRRLDATGYDFVMSIPDAKFSPSSTGKETDFDALAKELASPMGFTIQGGKLKSVAVDKNWSSFAASIARTVAAAFQLPTIDKDSSTRVWKAQEVDTTGDYEAEYAASSPTVLSKRKIAYRSLKVGQLQFGSLKTNLSPEIVSSEGSLAFAPDGTLKAFRSDEKTHVPMSLAAKVTSSTRLSLERVDPPTQPSNFDWNKALEKTRTLDAGAPYTGPIQANYDQLRIGHYTYETALAEVKKQAEQRARAAVPPKPKDDDEEGSQRELQERAEVFRAMAAILRAEPQRVPDAVREIRKKTPASRPLIDALATANTSESLAALVSLVNDDSLDEDWRGASARGLIRVKQTTPQSIAALTSLLERPKLRVHSLYGLGSVARRLEEEGRTGESQAVVQTLLRELRKKQSPTGTAQTLRGIANTGATSALESVIPFLQAASEEVRAAAVDALRLMHDPRVDALLVQVLLTDPKKTVRRGAAEAASARDPSEALLTGLQNAVTTDPDVKVRRQAVDTLIVWLPKHPELKLALETVARDDTRPSLKRAARDALDQQAGLPKRTN